MGEVESQSVRWFQAVIVSIAFHAVIVFLFFTPGFGSGRAVAPKEPAEGGERIEAPSEEPEVVTGPSEPERPTVPVRPPAPVRTVAPSPGRPPAPPPVATTASSGASEPSSTAQIPEFHIVRKGEFLTKIARKYGLEPEALAEINGKTLKEMNNLRVDQRIRLRK